MAENINCKVCDKETQQITYAHLKTHNMTFEEYFKKYPDAPLRSSVLEKRMIENQIKSQYSNNKCKICGKEIKWNQQFCSAKCSNSRRKVLSVEEYCLNCDKVFSKTISSTQKFCCRVCYDEFLRKNSKLTFTDLILKKYNHSCALCNSYDSIRIHHINGNPKDNMEENLIVLCES